MYMHNSQEKCVPKMGPIIAHFKILAFFSPYFVVMEFYYKLYHDKIVANFL